MDGSTGAGQVVGAGVDEGNDDGLVGEAGASEAEPVAALESTPQEESAPAMAAGEPATSEQAPAEQAPAELAPADQVPADQAPEEQVVGTTADEESTVQAAPVPVGDEQAPGTGDVASLPENKGVYSITPQGGGNVVSSDSKLAGIRKATSTLADYWQLKALGDQRYNLVSSKDGSKLSYTDNGIVGSVGHAVWLILSCVNDSLSLVPETMPELRLQASGTGEGSRLSLARADGSSAQRFDFHKMASLTEAAKQGVSVANGIYALTPGVGASQTLDVKGGSTANKANVQTYKANNSDAQRYTIRSVGGGLYTISVFKSDLVLEAAGGGIAKGTNVHQYRSNNTLAQLWYLTKNGQGYTLHNAKSGLVLDVKGGKAANGTNVQLYTSNRTKAQTFSLVRDLPLEACVKAGKAVAEGIYAVTAAVGDNLVLDVTGGSTAKGANIQAYKYANAFAQKVELIYAGKGRYYLKFANSGKYLDVKGGGTASGTNVQQWTKNSSRAQMWYFVDAGNGSFSIRSLLSGLALDVAGTQNKANVRVATANSGAAQRFSMTAVPLLADGTYVFSSVLAPAQLVEVEGASKTKGANVRINRIARSDGQQWTLTYLGSHRYRIANKASGMVLEVAGGSTAKGANVRQWTSNGTIAQQWVLGISDSGALTIKNAKSGLYLDLKDGKSVRGTNVQQWSGNGSKAQSFVPYGESTSFVKTGKTGYQNPSRYYQISAYNCVLPSYAKGFYTYVSPSVISPTATRSQCVEAFINRAMQYLGTSYKWDWSMAPGQGVDCSGLVMQCLYAVGMQTPYNPYDHMYDPWQDHNAENMHADNKFKKISFSQRQRGDLIFYQGHVAIYLGSDKIINATPGQVQIQSVYSWQVTGCSRVFV